jgi:hypothetical protein
MADDDVKQQLNDPWALNVLRKGAFPADLNITLETLARTGQFPEQDSFFISESAQIHDNAAARKLQRAFRIVITRGGANEALPTILISVPAGDRDGFIELMSWDAVKKAFNFYRRPRNGQWAWKGDTRDAFKAATAGQGCFACHVNGVPVMKELKLPWNNWHSQSASIVPEAVPNDAIKNSPLFTNKSEAQDLEPIIRGWIERATEARIADIMKGSTITDAPGLLRPLFSTTTVNLTTSGTESRAATPELNLPPGLFLKFDLFANWNITPPPGFSTRVKRPLYQKTLTAFAFRLQQGMFSMEGDTHFAFLVPETAAEDIVAIREMVTQKVLTPHFVAAVVLVDFPNPVFSPDRERLLQYVPATGHIQDGRSDLPERTAQAIVLAAATSSPGSPEKQFTEWWNQSPDQLQAESNKRVRAYLTAVQARLKTQAGVDDYTRLAESRRQRFAKSALHEFELLLPRTNIPMADRRMKTDGTISP